MYFLIACLHLAKEKTELIFKLASSNNPIFCTKDIARFFALFNLHLIFML